MPDFASFNSKTIIQFLSPILSQVERTVNNTLIAQTANISVIICTRNRSEHLQQCLRSLENLACQPEEIIVIDNAPSDELTRDVVTQFPKVKYKREPRAGLDIARNTGAYMASCDVIAYVDDDVTLHPLWALRIWESFSDPQVAAVTGLVFATKLDTEAQQIFEKHWSFNRGYVEKIYNRSFFESSNTPRVWEIGAGANMAFRKSVLNTTGYFDERLDVGAAGCNGDSELWYRILYKGYNIMYNPRVISYHDHRTDLPGLQKQIYNYMRGHVVASLIQQQQNSQAGYHQYVYGELPRYYLVLIKQGFPNFAFRYRTLFNEIKGIISGIAYYKKHCNTPSRIYPTSSPIELA